MKTQVKTSDQFRVGYDQTKIYRTFKAVLNGYMFALGKHHAGLYKQVVNHMSRHICTSKTDGHYVVALILNVGSKYYDEAATRLEDPAAMSHLNNALAPLGASVEVKRYKNEIVRDGVNVSGRPALIALHFNNTFKPAEQA